MYLTFLCITMQWYIYSYTRIDKSVRLLLGSYIDTLGAFIDHRNYRKNHGKNRWFWKFDHDYTSKFSCLPLAKEKFLFEVSISVMVILEYNYFIPCMICSIYRWQISRINSCVQKLFPDHAENIFAKREENDVDSVWGLWINV